jgi:RimJ/RimL family protein N-acetyltransferase
MSQAASDVAVRDCRLEDVRSVLELWRQAGATPGVTDTAGDLRWVIAESPAHALVAEVGGRIVGSILGSFDGWRGNIYRLAVHPDHRRKGVARALVAEVEKRLAQQGAKRITALVEKDHPRAMSFWEAVGYPVDERIVRRVRTLQVDGLARFECPTMTLAVNEDIHLSEFRPSDKAAIVEHLNEKAIYDRTLRIPYPYTQADADEWIAISAKAARQQGKPIHWAIRDRQATLIGGCGFDGLQLGKSHQAEIGYWLAKPYWGRGVMTAVVRTVCDFAFRQWGLSKITAHIFAFNNASPRLTVPHVRPRPRPARPGAAGSGRKRGEACSGGFWPAGCG